MDKIIDISELIPDDENANKGSEFGNSLIEKSLRKFGAGRSILLDKNNRIIAGNKTVENAAAIGLDDVIIVETDGTKLVAVKRNDIDLDSEVGREMAIADNASAKANIEWDEEVLEKVKEQWNVNAKDWGIVSIDFLTSDNSDKKAPSFTNNISTDKSAMYIGKFYGVIDKKWVDLIGEKFGLVEGDEMLNGSIFNEILQSILK